MEADAARVSGPGMRGATRTAGPTTTAPSAAGLGMAVTGFQAVGYAVLAATAAMAGGLAVAEQLTQAYASNAQQVLMGSEALGMNAQALQTWQVIGEKVGIDQGSMTTQLERFNRELALGAPTLKAAGLNLAALGVTSSDINKALPQVANWFHNSSNEAEKAAVAVALFGRGGLAMIPILDQGASAVSAYQAQLEQLGVVLNNTQLLQGATAQAAFQQFGEALTGVKNAMVSDILPGFTVFFTDVTQIITQHESVWLTFGQVVTNVMATIGGFLAGLTGTDLTKQMTDAGAVFGGLGQGAQGAGGGLGDLGNQANGAKDALAGLRDATLQQTDALTNEINALRDQERAQVESIDAQKQALQDQLDSITEVQDSRRRSGESLVDYERRLEENAIKDKITALDVQKTAIEQQTTDQVDQLERQKTALEQHLAQVQADMANAAAAQTQLATAPFDAGAAAAAKMAQQIAANMEKNAAAVTAGAAKMGKDFTGLFTQPSIDSLGRLTLDLQSFQARLSTNSLVTTAANAATAGGFSGLPLILQGIEGILGKLLSGHADGYLGASAHLAAISEGNQPEAVLPLSDPGRTVAIARAAGVDTMLAAASPSGAGGGLQQTVNFHGPVGVDAAAWKAIQRLETEARRRGLLAASGKF